jgi:DNA-binding NtrC family response regulator
MRWDTTVQERTKAEARPLTPTLRVLWSVSDTPPVGSLRSLPAGVLAIGRAVGEDGLALLQDPRVSRHHAELRLARGQMVVVDSSSTGTFVNGQRLGLSGGPSSCSLESGDLIRVGDSFLLYRSELEPDGALERHGLLGDSPAIRAVQHTLGLVGPTAATVLILGETGTGKELASRALHLASDRMGPLVAVNCSAISESLAESQLFGHSAGAFTGAKAAARGFLRSADGGTLFLDEVGELPLALQPKLLRALEERCVVPVGESQAVPFDARVVAATNRSLIEQVNAGAFRADLYARLGEFTLEMPPLRQRREDILPILIDALGAPPPELDAELVNALLLHAWPFNVRELRKVATQLAVRAQGARRLLLELFEPHLRQTSAQVAAAQPEPRTPSPPTVASEDVESEGRPLPVPDRAQLEALLRRWRGVIADVARETGRSRKQVYRWIEEHELDVTSYRD